MNYYQPNQRKSDGRWDYTRNNRPTGYCQAFKPFDKKFIENFRISESEVKRHNQFSDKYHEDGHASEEEACNCYKEYTLDHRLQLEHEDPNQQRKCEVCGEWTTKFATVGGYTLYHLCDSHRNREEVEKLYNAPTWSASSE